MHFEMDTAALQIARGGLLGAEKTVEEFAHAALAFVLACETFLIGPLGLDLLQSGTNVDRIHESALPAGC
jgi:hypothetical protein